MTEQTSSLALAELQHEHELFRRLLDLGACDALEPFLEETLALIAQVSRARKAYLELYDDSVDPTGAALSLAHGCDGEAAQNFRAGISQGVIGQAVATCSTILTASAVDDPRFRERGSVRRHHIEAVLCAPIGIGTPIGVIYLQQHADGGSFGEADRLRVQRFARHVAPFAERLLMRRRQQQPDPTRPFRASLRAEGLIGSSLALAWALQEVTLVAPLEAGVLLTGESGTGKTQIARVIHDSGPRRAGPFIEVNCAALPENLLEAELFGALPGAHSTAARKIDGKIAAAAGGTLFLDEVGELAPTAQSKLLQFLQSKQYFPLGGSQLVSADVRIVAATNVDLVDAIARRSFREDLYYRLAVMPIRVPSLAERREDIPALAEFFCRQACVRNRLPELRLSLAARNAAMTAEWSGNIRQLAHAIEGAAIRAAGGHLQEIEPHHLFPSRGPGGPSRALSFQEATRGFQEKLVRQALEDTGWNVAEAARLLDLSRAHTYNLISAFGIARPGR